MDTLHEKITTLQLYYVAQVKMLWKRVLVSDGPVMTNMITLVAACLSYVLCVCRGAVET